MSSDRKQRAGFLPPPAPIDRLPPHSPEAEQSVLGCILLSPNDCMEEFALLVKAGKEAFYDLRNQTIFEAMQALYAEKVPIDPISLKQRLTKWKRFEEVGGTTYLNSLPETVPSAANLSYYTEILVEKLIDRKILRVCAEVVLSVNEDRGTAAERMGQFESECLGVRQSVEEGRDVADLPAVFKELMGDYEQAVNHHHPPGIQTGFKEVDLIIGGFQPQQLVFVGASPSSGKTAWVLNVMENVILEQDTSVGIISLETSVKKLLHRITSSVARVDGSRLLRGTAGQEEFNQVLSASSKNGDITKIIKRLLVSDRGGLSIAQAAGIFRQFYKAGARLFILDYLQLLTSGKNNGARRVEEITLVSTGLKAIAKDLNCPVIVVSSINRDASKDDRKPRLSDLRDSGQLEFDADLVILLHRLDTAGDIRTVNLEVAKNKDGPIGETKLSFTPPQMRFCSPEDVGKPKPERQKRLL